ncbi:hypothetical protein [Tsukamurella soli]|uniref:hypothetical protein n=1 Tax=Tsukamurella soli TaxID=644556 RepID=UPI003615DA02
MDARDVGRRIADAQARARAARRRADGAAAVAERHEAALRDAGAMTRQMHETMAEIHRRTQQRHDTAASIHLAYAAALHPGPPRLRPGGPRSPEVAVPLFMTAVAGVLRGRGATLTLDDRADGLDVVVASTPFAKAVQDVELLLEEGPSHDVASGGEVVVAAPSEFSDRWSRYGPCVSELGVRSLVAVPLPAPQGGLGSLLILDPVERPISRATSRARAVAEALIDMIVAGSGSAAASLPPCHSSTRRTITSGPTRRPG